ncbi:MAG: glutathione peroxidase-family protein [Myxococcota bacterium]|jgi:glutathione peroxidase-family protein
MRFTDFTVQSIDGISVDLADYEGTIALVVNVASR